MSRAVLTPKRLIVLLASILAMGFIGFTGGARLEEMQRHAANVARVDGLALDLVRRAELATDYAFITILETSALTACGRAEIEDAEAFVLKRGGVRGLVVLDAGNTVRCSAPAQILQVASPSQLDEVEFLTGRNDSVSLGHLGDLLLVRLDRNGERTIAASSLGTMVYDFMPADIRDHASARVMLSHGETFAEYAGSDAPGGQPGAVRVFAASSSRYPISSEITVPQAVLASAGAAGQAWQPAAGALIGLLVAALVGALIVRPRTARDDLLDAIANGEITPHYQPIFGLSDGALSGCEVLARWIRPDGTTVGPDRFIPLAEAEGLVPTMTRRLALRCAQDLGGLCLSRPDFKLSINLPPDLLQTPDFVGELSGVFRAEGLPAGNVVFEVTERQSVRDSAATKQTISAARAMGFRFALDDTGVGHNGLANVLSLPVDFIKIDKCFVDLIDRSPESAGIVRMLVELAGEFGIKTVAEGIERREQLDALRKIGVHEGQGYLVAPALAPLAFVKLAADWGPPDRIKAMGEAEDVSGPKDPLVRLEAAGAA
jgi:EAL domain-containing protein (putative c-di-GMP-specific phosphodiesterase class I)